MTALLTFEDFIPGTVTRYGDLRVSAEDIVEFARAWDPQDFHTDAERARHTFVGKLIASGWHSCALMMRLLADHVVLHAASLGAPGIDSVRWLRPVEPGQRLHVRQTVLEARPSRSRPDRGLVRFRLELVDEAERPVLEQVNWVMFGRRGAAAIPPGRIREPRPSEPVAPDPPADPTALAFFDDLPVGHVSDLGEHAFPADEIIAFARRYDPQAFHVDPEAARESAFGGLCASGWQTAAAWMRRRVDQLDRVRTALRDAGGEPPRLGPSPGFTDLVWKTPVFAGDVIAYRSTVTGKKPSGSRPGWGLVFTRNEGWNRAGEQVLSFDAAVFWERRG